MVIATMAFAQSNPAWWCGDKACDVPTAQQVVDATTNSVNGWTLDAIFSCDTAATITLTPPVDSECIDAGTPVDPSQCGTISFNIDADCTPTCIACGSSQCSATVNGDPTITNKCTEECSCSATMTGTPQCGQQVTFNVDVSHSSAQLQYQVGSGSPVALTTKNEVVTWTSNDHGDIKVLIDGVAVSSIVGSVAQDKACSNLGWYCGETQCGLKPTSQEVASATTTTSLTGWTLSEVVATCNTSVDATRTTPKCQARFGSAETSWTQVDFDDAVCPEPEPTDTSHTYTFGQCTPTCSKCGVVATCVDGNGINMNTSACSNACDCSFTSSPTSLNCGDKLTITVTKPSSLASSPVYYNDGTQRAYVDPIDWTSTATGSIKVFVGDVELSPPISITTPCTVDSFEWLCGTEDCTAPDDATVAAATTIDSIAGWSLNNLPKTSIDCSGQSVTITATPTPKCVLATDSTKVLADDLCPQPKPDAVGFTVSNTCQETCSKCGTASNCESTFSTETYTLTPSLCDGQCACTFTLSGITDDKVSCGDEITASITPPTGVDAVLTYSVDGGTTKVSITPDIPFIWTSAQTGSVTFYNGDVLVKTVAINTACTPANFVWYCDNAACIKPTDAQIASQAVTGWELANLDQLDCSETKATITAKTSAGIVVKCRLDGTTEVADALCTAVNPQTVGYEYESPNKCSTSCSACDVVSSCTTTIGSETVTLNGKCAGKCACTLTFTGSATPKCGESYTASWSIPTGSEYTGAKQLKMKIGTEETTITNATPYQFLTFTAGNVEFSLDGTRIYTNPNNEIIVAATDVCTNVGWYCGEKLCSETPTAQQIQAATTKNGIAGWTLDNLVGDVANCDGTAKTISATPSYECKALNHNEEFIDVEDGLCPETLPVQHDTNIANTCTQTCTSCGQAATCTVTIATGITSTLSDKTKCDTSCACGLKQLNSSGVVSTDAVACGGKLYFASSNQDLVSTTQTVSIKDGAEVLHTKSVTLTLDLVISIDIYPKSSSTSLTFNIGAESFGFTSDSNCQYKYSCQQPVGQTTTFGTCADSDKIIASLDNADTKSQVKLYHVNTGESPEVETELTSITEAKCGDLIRFARTVACTLEGKAIPTDITYGCNIEAKPDDVIDEVVDTCVATTCSDCNTATQCDAKFGTEDIQIGDESCNNGCSCALTNIQVGGSATPTAVACGDEITVTWDYTSPFVDVDAEVAVKSTAEGKALLFSLPTVAPNVKTTKFKLFAPAGHQSVLVTVGTLEITVPLAAECVYENRCQTLESTGSTPVYTKCEVIDAALLADTSQSTHWGFSNNPVESPCGTRIQAAAETPVCYTSTGVQFDVSFADNAVACAQFESTYIEPVQCIPTCTACYDLTSAPEPADECNPKWNSVEITGGTQTCHELCSCSIASITVTNTDDSTPVTSPHDFVCGEQFDVTFKFTGPALGEPNTIVLLDGDTVVYSELIIEADHKFVITPHFTETFIGKTITVGFKKVDGENADVVVPPQAGIKFEFNFGAESCLPKWQCADKSGQFGDCTLPTPEEVATSTTVAVGSYWTVDTVIDFTCPAEPHNIIVNPRTPTCFVQTKEVDESNCSLIEQIHPQTFTLGCETLCHDGTEIAPCSTTAPSASEAAALDALISADGLWVLDQKIADLSCGDSLTISPRDAKCYREVTHSNESHLIETTGCLDTAPTPVIFAVACDAVCTTKCNQAESCGATLDSVPFEMDPSTCADQCDCTITSLTSDVTSVDCGGKVTLAWIGSSTNADAVIDIVIGGVLDLTIPNVRVDAEEFTFTLAHVGDGSIIFALLDQTAAVLIGSQCEYQWLCIDENSAVIECNTLNPTLCTTCGDVDVPLGQYACYVGDTLSDDSEKCSTLPTPSLTCTCEEKCLGSDESSYVDCNEEGAWAVSTVCGGFDTRTTKLVTESGDEIPCTDDDCTLPTTRVLPANIEACTVTTACQLNGETDWVSCTDQTGFDCDNVDATNCPKTITRLVQCSVAVDGSDALIKASGNDDFATQLIALYSQSDIDISTDAALTASLTSLDTSCTTLEAAVTLTEQCDCSVGLWCWVDTTVTTVPESENVGDESIELCNSDGFPTCSQACKDAGVEASEMDKTRSVFCRATDGKFVQSASGGKCGDYDVVDSDLKKVCPIELQCFEANFCREANNESSPITESELNQSADAIAIGSDGVAQCAAPDSYGSSCWTKDTDTFTYQACTYNPSGVAGTDMNNYIFIVESKCLVYTKDAQGGPVALADGVLSGDLCTALAEFPTTSSDCSDYEGCSLGMTAIYVYGEEASYGYDAEFEIDEANLDLISFDWSQLGPLDAETTIVFHWAYKVASTSAADTTVWFPLGTVNPVDRDSNTFSYDFSTLNLNFAAAVDHKLTIYVRAFVVGSDSSAYEYPLTLTVNENQSCSSGRVTFTGINEACGDDTNGVAQVKCTVSPVTSTQTTQTGQCSRNSVCDTQSATTCQNGGWLTVVSATSCSSKCFCPGGQNPDDKCGTCIECPVSRGIAKTDGCGCQTCRTGFSNPAGLCDTCSISASIKITDPSPAFQNALGSLASDAESVQFAIFERDFTHWVAKLVEFDAAGIAISKTESTVSATELKLVLTFTGDCTTIAKEPSAFITLATTDLNAVVNNFSSRVTSEAIIAEPSAQFFLSPTSTVSAVETAFTPPTLYVPVENPDTPEDPDTPTDDDDGTDIVVIIVPIIVVVVVIIVVAVVLYICCFKDKASNGNSSSSSTKSKAPKAPKAPKSPTNANKTDFKGDTAHLELV